MSEKVMHFKVIDGQKTYEGVLTVPDDDGTSTLPMMAHSLIKQLTEDRPELHKSRRIVIEVELLSPTETEEKR